MLTNYKAISACLACAFAVTLLAMYFGWFKSIDEAILLLPRQSDDLGAMIGGKRFAQLINDFTSLGGLTVLFSLTAATVGFFLVKGHSHLAMILSGTVLSGFAISATLKILVGRARPEIVPHLIPVHDASFPSGHAMVSAVTYISLGLMLAAIEPRRCVKQYVVAVVALFVLLIGTSRIFLGVHYPSDVLAGWFLGAAWAVFCIGLAQQYLLKR